MNVIVIVIDTLRYDHVSPESEVPVETPNLDRLADRSWWFSSAFASSFPTIPTRQDILHGRGGRPFHAWTPLDCGTPTLPGVLADAGYVTQLIHDTPHLVNGGFRFDYPFHAWTPIRGAECDRPWIADRPTFPDNWAFDDRFDGYGLARDTQEAFEGSKASLRNYAYAHRNRESTEDWNVARLFRTTARFLHDNADRENFFLWVDCFDPHEPWDAPPEYVRRYDEAGRDGRVDPRGFHENVYNDPDLSTAAREHKVAQYRAKVSFTDHWFGTFVDTLDETGLADDTAVVVLGDHGTNVNDNPDPNGRTFGKQSPPAENEAHVPLMLYVPGAGSGRCDSPVRLLDVFGTVTARAGATVPAGANSVDLLEVATTPEYEPHTLAPTGKHVGDWAGASPSDVLFYAYDRDWCLGVAADPSSCLLRRRGDGVDVAADNAETVDRLRADAISELAEWGLDDRLVSWLESDTPGTVPETFDAGGSPSPDWFQPYFNRPIPE